MKNQKLNQRTTTIFPLTRQAWNRRNAEVSRELDHNPALEETVLALYQIGLARQWINDPAIVLDRPTPIYQRSNPFPLYNTELLNKTLGMGGLFRRK